MESSVVKKISLIIYQQIHVLISFPFAVAQYSDKGNSKEKAFILFTVQGRGSSWQESRAGMQRTVNECYCSLSAFTDARQEPSQEITVWSATVGRNQDHPPDHVHRPIAQVFLSSYCLALSCKSKVHSVRCVINKFSRNIICCFNVTG